VAEYTVPNGTAEHGLTAQTAQSPHNTARLLPFCASHSKNIW